MSLEQCWDLRPSLGHIPQDCAKLDAFCSSILVCCESFQPRFDLFEVVSNAHESQLNEAFGFSSQVEGSEVHVAFDVSKDGLDIFFSSFHHLFPLIGQESRSLSCF